MAQWPFSISTPLSTTELPSLCPVTPLAHPQHGPALAELGQRLIAAAARAGPVKSMAQMRLTACLRQLGLRPKLADGCLLLY